MPSNSKQRENKTTPPVDNWQQVLMKYHGSRRFLACLECGFAWAVMSSLRRVMLMPWLLGQPIRGLAWRHKNR